MYRPAEAVDFERVTDEPLCACIFGSFSTDQKDLHGHVVPPGSYIKFVESMKTNPKIRIVNVHHDPSQPIGEILWADILVDKEDVVRLVGGVGIYEGEKDRIQEIENDILGGFSITLCGYINTTAEDWNSEDIVLEYRGPGEHYNHIRQINEAKQIPTHFKLGKSAEGELLIQVVENNLKSIIELGVSLWLLRETKRIRKSAEQNQEGQSPQIKIQDSIINLEGLSIEEFLEKYQEALDVKLPPEDIEELKRRRVLSK